MQNKIELRNSAGLARGYGNEEFGQIDFFDLRSEVIQGQPS